MMSHRKEGDGEQNGPGYNSWSLQHGAGTKVGRAATVLRAELRVLF